MKKKKKGHYFKLALSHMNFFAAVITPCQPHTDCLSPLRSCVVCGFRSSSNTGAVNEILYLKRLALAANYFLSGPLLCLCPVFTLGDVFVSGLLNVSLQYLPKLPANGRKLPGPTLKACLEFVVCEKSFYCGQLHLADDVFEQTKHTECKPYWKTASR